MAAVICGAFFCGGAHAQWVVHDPVSFVGIIEEVYNGYERILGMYNQIKTQAEQYAKQVQAMSTFKERFQDSMSDSMSNLKDAFKDLNSWENLTDIQKIEASRQSFRNLVKTEQAYEQEMWDVTAGLFSKSVTSPSGKKYTLGDVIGFDKNGHYNPDADGSNVLSDIDDYFKKQKKDLVDQFWGNITPEEREKLYAKYGASDGAIVYFEMREEQRNEAAVRNGANTSNMRINKEKQETYMKLDGLNKAIEEAEKNQSNAEAVVANAKLQLENNKLAAEEVERLNWLIASFERQAQEAKDEKAILRLQEEEEKKKVQQWNDEKWSSVYVRTMY